MKIPIKISGCQTFTVINGAVNIADPCYRPETWCGEYNILLENGEYFSFVVKSDDWGERVSQLYVFNWKYHNQIAGWLPEYDSLTHIELALDISCNLDTKFNHLGQLGVDSGQMSVIDSGEFSNEDDFYDMICELTLTRENWGVFDFGVACSSGYGDGSYDLYSFQKNDNNIGFMVDFGLLHEDEEEYDEIEELDEL